MSEFIVKDSGERREFSTGSVRDRSAGKGRFDLFPPLALIRLAKHYENGSAKYGDRNWEKGQPTNEMFNSGYRHATDYLAGMRDEDHLIAAVWNFLGIVEIQERIKLGLLPADLDTLNDENKTLILKKLIQSTQTELI